MPLPSTFATSTISFDHDNCKLLIINKIHYIITPLQELPGILEKIIELKKLNPSGIGDKYRWNATMTLPLQGSIPNRMQETGRSSCSWSLA